jgi:hypothetical protein
VNNHFSIIESLQDFASPEQLAKYLLYLREEFCSDDCCDFKNIDFMQIKYQIEMAKIWQWYLFSVY